MRLWFILVRRIDTAAEHRILYSTVTAAAGGTGSGVLAAAVATWKSWQGGCQWLPDHILELRSRWQRSGPGVRVDGKADVKVVDRVEKEPKWKSINAGLLNLHLIHE